MHGSSSEGGGELSVVILKNKSIVLNPFKLKQYKPYIPAIFRKPESEILNLDQEKYIVIDSQSDHAKWPFKNLNEYFHNDMKVFFATCFLFYGESSARLAKAKLLAKLMGIRKGWIWGAYHVHAQYFTIETPLGFVDASLPFSIVDNSDDKLLIDSSEMMESMKENISGFSFEITEGEVKNVKSGYMYDFFFFDFLGGKRRPVTDEQLRHIEIMRSQMIQE